MSTAGWLTSTGADYLEFPPVPPGDVLRLRGHRQVFPRSLHLQLCTTLSSLCHFGVSEVSVWTEFFATPSAIEFLVEFTGTQPLRPSGVSITGKLPVLSNSGVRIGEYQLH